MPAARRRFTMRHCVDVPRWPRSSNRSASVPAMMACASRTPARGRGRRWSRWPTGCRTSSSTGRARCGGRCSPSCRASYTLIRYDERGCGLSDWNVGELSFEAWVRDLETVVDATGVDRFPLLGLSQGASIAIAYAVRHPERVSHLILHGGYARGRLQRAADAAAARGGRDDEQARGARLGPGEPRVPPVLHDAVHPRRLARAASLVQRARADLDVAAERGAVHARVQRHQRRRPAAAGSHARRSYCTRVATRACRSTKAG